MMRSSEIFLMGIKQGAIVRVKSLNHLTDEDENFPDVFIRSRKKNKIGIVDSPVYDNYNHYWLVKHDTSCLVRGVSIGRYGIYHDNELETWEIAPQEVELPTESFRIEESPIINYFGD
jgi:hypothetical protein